MALFEEQKIYIAYVQIINNYSPYGYHNVCPVGIRQKSTNIKSYIMLVAYKLGKLYAGL